MLESFHGLHGPLCCSVQNSEDTVTTHFLCASLRNTTVLIDHNVATSHQHSTFKNNTVFLTSPSLVFEGDLSGAEKHLGSHSGEPQPTCLPASSAALCASSPGRRCDFWRLYASFSPGNGLIGLEKCRSMIEK